MPKSEISAPFSFRPWLLVAVFSLLLFLITAATYSSLGVVIPAMVPELGWSWEHAFLGSRSWGCSPACRPGCRPC